ncbi:MAG: division/cell wall cluster transcriptional repressor MraZ [Gemmatimonadota bacterium]|nr:division/cell wall cluster transcriptional repressor MraZ [Gemmatimonadota bacterium]
MANFMGSFSHAVDHKGRVNVPTKFRNDIPTDTDDALVVTRGLDGCLFAYPLDEWKKVEDRLRSLPITKQKTRQFIRMMTSQATSMRMDKQGRITLPKSLLDLAKIEMEILIVGTLDHFELWCPEEFERCLNDTDQTYEEVAESIFDNDLAV